MTTEIRKLSDLIEATEINALIERQDSIAKGYAAWVCGMPIDGLSPVEQEGWQDAATNYEVWREAAIREFDQRK